MLPLIVALSVCGCLICKTSIDIAADLRSAPVGRRSTDNLVTTQITLLSRGQALFATVAEVAAERAGGSSCGCRSGICRAVLPEARRQYTDSGCQSGDRGVFAAAAAAFPQRLFSLK